MWIDCMYSELYPEVVDSSNIFSSLFYCEWRFFKLSFIQKYAIEMSGKEGR